MNNEKIKVKVTETGQVIEVVLGEGVHNMKCSLTPTRNGMAYVGSVKGRELVYERSRDKVAADIEMQNPNVRGPRAR